MLVNNIIKYYLNIILLPNSIALKLKYEYPYIYIYALLFLITEF